MVFGGLNKGGGRKNNAGSADGNEQVAAAEQGFDFVHAEEVFAEKDDVGFHHAGNAALGADGFGVNVAEGFQNVSAVEADGLVYLAVNVVNVFIAGFSWSVSTFWVTTEISAGYSFCRRVIAKCAGLGLAFWISSLRSL